MEKNPLYELKELHSSLVIKKQNSEQQKTLERNRALNPQMIDKYFDESEEIDLNDRVENQIENEEIQIIELQVIDQRREVIHDT